MKSILIWNKPTQDKVRALIKRAKQNIVSLERIKQIQTKESPPIGDTPENSIVIGNHRIVYSIEEQPKDTYKHISVSIIEPTFQTIPAPIAVSEILKVFGFKNWNQKDWKITNDFAIWEEKIGIVTAINILERDSIGLDYIGKMSFDIGITI